MQVPASMTSHVDWGLWRAPRLHLPIDPIPMWRRNRSSFDRNLFCKFEVNNVLRVV